MITLLAKRIRNHYLLPVVLFACMARPASAQYDTAIHFNKYAYEEIFNYSKIMKKPIMLYFHIDGCGACIQMERTAFKQPDIYSYINKNFIVYNINTRKGEGIEINQTYQIVLNPTILFVNYKGKEIDRVEGYQGMVSLYEHLKRAVEKTQIYNYFVIDYNIGRRNSDFLYEYTRVLDMNDDLDSNQVIMEYLETQKPAQLLSDRNMAYIYDFMLRNHKVMIGPKHIAFQTMFNNQEAFAKHFRKSQIEARLIYVLYEEIRKSCRNGGADFDYLYSMIRTFHGRKNIFYEEPDGRLTDGIYAVDTNEIRMDYNRCLYVK